MAPVRPGLLVVGEAAGLTYSLSGEGIGKAMESGLLAAEIIGRGWPDARVDPHAAAREYETRLVAAFAGRFRGYEAAQRWLAYPAVANFLAWRGRSGTYVRRQLEGLLAETTDPAEPFSIGGLFRALWR